MKNYDNGDDDGDKHGNEYGSYNNNDTSRSGYDGPIFDPIMAPQS